jgi:gas vesicle protein
MICFLLGVAIGGALALLFAPTSGEETREKLRQTAEDGMDFIDSKKREFRDTAEELSRKGKEMRRKAEDAIEKGKKTVQDLKDKGSDLVSHLV